MWAVFDERWESQVSCISYLLVLTQVPFFFFSSPTVYYSYLITNYATDLACWMVLLTTSWCEMNPLQIT